jgi:hypothetical protein
MKNKNDKVKIILLFICFVVSLPWIPDGFRMMGFNKLAIWSYYNELSFVNNFISKNEKFVFLWPDRATQKSVLSTTIIPFLVSRCSKSGDDLSTRHINLFLSKEKNEITRLQLLKILSNIATPLAFDLIFEHFESSKSIVEKSIIIELIFNSNSKYSHYFLNNYYHFDFEIRSSILFGLTSTHVITELEKKQFYLNIILSSCQNSNGRIEDCIICLTKLYEFPIKKNDLIIYTKLLEKHNNFEKLLPFVEAQFAKYYRRSNFGFYFKNQNDELIGVTYELRAGSRNSDSCVR